MQLSNRLIPATALAAILFAPLGASAQVTTNEPLTPIRLPAPVFNNGQPVNTPYGTPYGGVGVRRGSMFLQTVESLNLAPGQRQRIESLINQRRMENSRVGGDKAARQGDNRRMRQEIKSLLTPQQRQELKQRLRQMRANRRGMRGNPNGVRVQGEE